MPRDADFSAQVEQVMLDVAERRANAGGQFLGEQQADHRIQFIDFPQRVHALGEVDELNSVIGLLLAEELPAGVRAALGNIQHDLFDLGGEVCIPGHASMSESQVTRLEVLLDDYNRDLPPLKEFILPGGTRAASLAHLARTVCRRAERALVSLARTEPVG